MKTTHKVTIHGQPVTITIRKVETRFGVLFVPENDYGEPVMVVGGFSTEQEALDDETKSLTQILGR